jgi:diguanylate cyclase (GGDEF)-like protein
MRLLARLRHFRRHNPLTIKILLAIVLASSLFATAVTLIHMYSNYRQALTSLDVRLRDAEYAFLPSLLDAVWRVDEPLIDLNLNAINQLPFVDFAILNTPNMDSVAVGERSLGPFTEIKSYNLTYQLGGQLINIGELLVHINKETIYATLGREMIILLILNFIKTLSVSLIIMYILHKLLFRHLNELRKTASSISLDQLNVPFKLGRPTHKEVDELDEVCQSLEGMRIRLAKGVKELQETRAERVRVYQAAMSSKASVFITSGEGLIRFMNQECQRLFDQLGLDARVLDTDLLLRRIDPHLSLSSIITHQHLHDHFVKEVFLTTLTEKPIWIEIQCHHYYNGFDSEDQYVFSITDTTELKNAYARQQELTQTDPITQLPNLRMALEHLGNCLNALTQERGHLALVLFSLRAYRPVMESFGLEYADLMMLKSAERISAVLPLTSFLARSGEGEFLCILQFRERNAATLFKLLEDISAQFDLPIKLSQHEVDAHLVGGIATAPNDGDDPETLHKHAMSALYKAKKNTGRDRFYFYEPTLKDGSFRRLFIASRIRSGHCLKEIFVHYQPILSREGRHVVGCEALARWENSELGQISPTEFIAEAERLGEIDTLGEIILMKACFDAKEWQKDLPDFYVSVNVSPIQLEDDAFVCKVKNALALSGLPPNSLKLEVTEQLYLPGSESILQRLKALTDLGVRIAIDDFGSGYASLNYMCCYPFQTLKIDQAFIKRLTQDKSSQVLVQSVIQISKSLGLDTVAEGVEDLPTQKILEQMGCDYLQGYLYSVPIEPGVFKRLLPTKKQQSEPNP